MAIYLAGLPNKPLLATYCLLLSKLDSGGQGASYLNTGKLIALLTLKNTVVTLCTTYFYIKRLFI
jgi:hypothetical protein